MSVELLDLRGIDVVAVRINGGREDTVCTIIRKTARTKGTQSGKRTVRKGAANSHVNTEKRGQKGSKGEGNQH